MRCPLGKSLLASFESAAQCRTEATDRYGLCAFGLGYGDEAFNMAKQDYSAALAAWITHRAFCLDCRGHIGQTDRIEFASV